MKKPVSLIVIALLAGLLFAGCGKSTSPDSSPSAQSTNVTTSASPTGGGASAGNIVMVTMKGIQFNPASVTVKVGQTVEWTNDDGVTHTVTAKSDGLDSGDVGSAKTFQFITKKAGVIHYVCEIHSGMKGTIVVKA
jgi:plastocyanin